MKPRTRNQGFTNVATKRLKLYCFLIALLTILIVCYLNWQHPDPGVPENELQESESNVFNEYKREEMSLREQKPVFVGDKIVHLDLKGAPPKISYYRKLFPLLSKLGATGLLVEYEDMFPYKGKLSNISALNCYTLEEIQTINVLAKQSNLKLIPLVQTFGHLEFVLKLASYKDMREVYAYPQVICPTHEKTIDLLVDMITQVVEAHPDSNMLHIGADEVYYLGMCNRCTDFMQKYNFSKTALFLEHIGNVVELINKRYPNLRVLMWDDEFRSISPAELKRSPLIRNVEPVVWKYTREVYEELGPSLWQSYSKAFNKVWAASAFKGATGSNEFVSQTTHYLQNHRGWLSVIAEYKDRVNFQGIILTGWQRYDHFAVLCELLPVGIPTLAMSLRLLLGYNDSPLSPPTEVAKVLRCEQPYALIGPAFGSPKCLYPGGRILESVLHLQQLKRELEDVLEDSRAKGWFSEYNIEYGFSNPSYIETVTEPLIRIQKDLIQIRTDITTAMEEVYDQYTIDEWKETYLQPFEKKIDKLIDARSKLLSKDSWPRRPLRKDEL